MNWKILQRGEVVDKKEENYVRSKVKKKWAISSGRGKTPKGRYIERLISVFRGFKGRMNYIIIKGGN